MEAQGGGVSRRESERPCEMLLAVMRDAVTRTGLTVDLLTRDPGDLDKSCSAPKPAWVGSWENGSASGKRADLSSEGLRGPSLQREGEEWH